MNLIYTDQFREFENDSTKQTHKITKHTQEFKNKLKENDIVEDLPLRPIISNVGTAIYKTAKYLATLLPAVTSSEHNTKTSYEFVKSIKNTQIPNSYKMISFDAKNLITNLCIFR